MSYTTNLRHVGLAECGMHLAQQLAGFFWKEFRHLFERLACSACSLAQDCQRACIPSLSILSGLYSQIGAQDNTPGRFDFPTTLKSFLVPFTPAKSAIACTPFHLPGRIARFLSLELSPSFGAYVPSSSVFPDFCSDATQTKAMLGTT